MKVSAVQFEPAFNDLDKNLIKIEELIKDCVTQESELIVLPELATSGYNFRDTQEIFSIAEEIPNGRTEQTAIDHALTRHDNQPDDHEMRIKKLERIA